MKQKQEVEEVLLKWERIWFDFEGSLLEGHWVEVIQIWGGLGNQGNRVESVDKWILLVLLLILIVK
jgi:hypothetical protein